MKVVFRTHIGNIRENNEDFVYISKNEPCYILVADGMGGAAAGEIASKMAAYSVIQFIDEHKESGICADTLSKAVIYANEQIMSETKYNGRLAGMGTTMTLAHINGKKLILAQVGDSGAYLLSKKGLSKITKDHTYVQRLIDSGLIDENKAEDYPLKNIITRVVGMEELEVDTYELLWGKGDTLFLFTDGLTTYVKNEELASILAGEDSLDDKADRLLSAALSRGGRDNISFILAQNCEGGGTRDE